MRNKFFLLTLLLAMFTLIPACEKEPLLVDDTQSAQITGTGQSATLRSDPCEGTDIIELESYERVTNKKWIVNRLFSMSEDADACLTVINNGVKAVWIKIDGVKVFGPQDFKHGVNTLQHLTFLTYGDHEITITTTGKAEGIIYIQLRANLDVPPPLPKCSKVAAADCVSRGWQVVGTFPDEGILVCTIDGRSYRNNCDTCGTYNIYVWKNGAREQTCLEDGFMDTYTTQAGTLYGGHVPCSCEDNLFFCGNWYLKNCIPD